MKLQSIAELSLSKKKRKFNEILSNGRIYNEKNILLKKDILKTLPSSGIKNYI